MTSNNHLYICNLCRREFKRFNTREESQILGISLGRSKTYSLTLDFVAPSRSEVDRHICKYCVSDILNKQSD